MPAKDQIKEVNFEQLRTLVRIQCTAEECAAILDMSDVTLDTRLKEAGYAGFLEFYKRYNHEGRASLRRAQWKAAVDEGNPTMLIWMGKQMLGQKDRFDASLTGADGGAIKIEADISAATKLTQMVNQIAERSGEAGKPPES